MEEEIKRQNQKDHSVRWTSPKLLSLKVEEEAHKLRNVGAL